MKKIRYKELLQKLLLVIGMGVIITNNLLMIYTFMLAYFNPTKTVIVDINNFGEANAEFIFMIVTFPIVVYLLARMVFNEKGAC